MTDEGWEDLSNSEIRRRITQRIGEDSEGAFGPGEIARIASDRFLDEARECRTCSRVIAQVLGMAEEER